MRNHNTKKRILYPEKPNFSSIIKIAKKKIEKENNIFSQIHSEIERDGNKKKRFFALNDTIL